MRDDTTKIRYGVRASSEALIVSRRKETFVDRWNLNGLFSSSSESDRSKSGFLNINLSGSIILPNRMRVSFQNGGFPLCPSRLAKVTVYPAFSAEFGRPTLLLIQALAIREQFPRRTQSKIRRNPASERMRKTDKKKADDKNVIRGGSVFRMIFKEIRFSSSINGATTSSRLETVNLGVNRRRRPWPRIWNRILVVSQGEDR